MNAAPEKPLEKTLSLLDIAQLGRIEKSKEILKGFTVGLQTLSASNQQKILASLPSDNSDSLARFVYTQVEALVYATADINGTKYGDSNRAELRTLYSSMQSKVLQETYSFYGELVQEQNSVIDSLKKTQNLIRLLGWITKYANY